MIEHLERNDGNWPRSWDELAESFEIFAGRNGRMWSLDELRARVAVDFDADLVPLKLLSDLRELHLGHSNITDLARKPCLD